MPPRPVKKVTARSLKNRARAYLERYAAPRAHLRRLLIERGRRSVAEHGGDLDEIAGWIDAALDELQAQGMLNDAAFAQDRARRLRARGGSERAIRQGLSLKGVEPSEIDAALDKTRPAEGGDLAAALTFARKRRMGPWREGEATPDTLRKELGRFARAGFTYAVARQALDADPTEHPYS